MKLVTVTIDGIKTEAEDRTPLVQVAQKVGVKIPTLCHHPLVEPYGVCRICTVEVHMRGRVRTGDGLQLPRHRRHRGVHPDRPRAPRRGR